MKSQKIEKDKALLLSLEKTANINKLKIITKETITDRSNADEALISGSIFSPMGIINNLTYWTNTFNSVRTCVSHGLMCSAECVM